MQDELDDILRYGAAELFADAVASSQQAQQAQQAGTSSDADKGEHWPFRASCNTQCCTRLHMEGTVEVSL